MKITCQSDSWRGRRCSDEIFRLADVFAIQTSIFFVAPLLVCVLWKKEEMSDDEMLWFRWLGLAVLGVVGYGLGFAFAHIVWVLLGN